MPTSLSESERVRRLAEKLGLEYWTTHSSAVGIWGEVGNSRGVLLSGQVEPYNELYAMLGAYQIGRTAAGRAPGP